METLLNKKAEIMAQKYNQNANNSWQTDPRSGKTEYAQIAPQQNIVPGLQAIMDQAAARRTVKYSAHVIPPPPTQALIQFIGGPKNAEQEYVPYVDYIPGAEHRIAMVSQMASIEYLPDGSLRNIPAVREYMIYKLTPIPLDQTPFSDAQIVIALFQELKTA